MRLSLPLRVPFAALSLAAVTIGCGSGGGRARHEEFSVRYLVADPAFAAATPEHVDADLINGWGLAPNPAGAWWVSAADSSKSLVYDEDGVSPFGPVDVPGNPTGIVFNAGGGFPVTDGTTTAPSTFLMASEDGTISGWNSGVPAPSPSTTAFVVIDRSSAGASYKGLAILESRIYATDFHNARVEVFDDSFAQLALPGTAFQPPTGGSGYAPFGIQAIEGQIFVTWALQDAAGDEEVTGPGLGFVEAYDADGNFLFEVARHGGLNAPWGLALAPSTGFGDRSGQLLVGNFGDGRIFGFKRAGSSNQFVSVGPLLDTDRQPIEIDGLWGIAFGVGGATGPTSTLFFAAGPEDESQGLFGRIDLAE